MIRFIAALVLVFGLATSAAAQVGPDQFLQDHLHWVGHEDLVDKLSTIGVGISLLAPCFDTFLHPSSQTLACLEVRGIRVGVVIAAVEILKHYIHRDRPDGSDNKSFPSMHTAIACAATVGTKWVAFCPAIALSRVVADKHWSTDVGAGAAIGGLVTLTW